MGQQGLQRAADKFFQAAQAARVMFILWGRGPVDESTARMLAMASYRLDLRRLP